MDKHDELAVAVGQALKARGLMLATAESCTGGAVAKAITDVPGSSAWFDCGYVTYSNTSKTEMLDVPTEQIAEYGAVSVEVAAAMAAGALAHTQADVAISTTGIAGPTGAVPGKPLGTVCMACVIGQREYTDRQVFSGDREAVRTQTVEHVLRALLRFLEDVPASSQ